MWKIKVTSSANFWRLLRNFARCICLADSSPLPEKSVLYNAVALSTIIRANLFKKIPSNQSGRLKFMHHAAVMKLWNQSQLQVIWDCHKLKERTQNKVCRSKYEIEGIDMFHLRISHNEEWVSTSRLPKPYNELEINRTQLIICAHVYNWWRQ